MIELNLENNINKSKVTKDNDVNNLIAELKDTLEKDFSINKSTKTDEKIQLEEKNFVENQKEYNFIDQSERYKEFWEYQNSLEDNVCAILGISRYEKDNIYFDEIYKAVDKSIFELSDREECALYIASGPNSAVHTSPKGRLAFEPVYDIDKYENGKIEHSQCVQVEGLPEKSDNGNTRNIIYQVGKDGKLKIRPDLKEEAIKSACEKCMKIKEETLKESEKYKKEGHLYEVHKYDGYVFLNDITEDNYSFEDIDFVVDNYEGEGIYQVIDGKYIKIDDKFYSEID